MIPTPEPYTMSPVALIVLLIVLAALYLPLAALYRRHLAVSTGWRVLLVLGTLLLLFGLAYGIAANFGRPHPVAPVHHMIGTTLLWVFLIPLLVRLCTKWIDGGLTDAKLSRFPSPLSAVMKWGAGGLTDDERSPDMNAVRAWLRPGNVACVFAVSVLASFGFGYSFWSLLALGLGALIVYPAINMLFSTHGSPPRPEEAHFDERERVLKMLEGGNITANEAADLLNAIGQSVPSQGRKTSPTTQGRKLVLVGAVLLLAGFFLPWFSINLGSEMERLGERMHETTGLPAGTIPALAFGAETVHINGGAIGNGLGWLVLALGMGAVVISFVASDLDRETQWKISLLALGIGAIVLLYLLTQGIRYTSIGLIVVMAAYALEILGTVKDRPPAAGG